MERYRNLSGNSGVSGYEIGTDYIRVAFNGNPKIYSYSNRGRAGRVHVDNMKRCAVNGLGLNSYINEHVKYLYDL